MYSHRILTNLSTLSGLLAQSVELEDILPTAAEMVASIMEMEVVAVYSMEAESGELVLLASYGMTSQFAKGVDRMKLGEGFNGRVAETGEPMLATDVSNDPRLSREVVRQEHLQITLIVPMKWKGQVVGTLCVATRQRCGSPAEKMGLLAAIGNEIGIAIQNACLYHEQMEMTKQLKRSEANYRDLFQNASDAIWVHDLEGRMIEANNACEKLTGYTLEELSARKAADFLAPDALDLAKEVRTKLLKGETIDQRYEQRIIRKDGTAAIIELATRLVTTDGKPVAFQNIARDVTEGRRMRDNLRFYLREILKTQEEERKRISRELHDDVAQSMLLLTRRLDDLISNPDSRLSKMTKEALGQIYNLGVKTHSSLRDYARSLRPDLLDHLGLISALEWMAEEMSQEHGIKVSVEVHGSEHDLSPETKLVLFRIAQEALSNIRRHAEAKNVLIKLQRVVQRVTMTISDDGKGFELPQRLGDLARTGRLGLTGMEERAGLIGGSLEVKSELGKGTIVTVEADI
ncbi:PAS domain S-box protein [Chloroflexota bacterium]